MKLRETKISTNIIMYMETWLNSDTIGHLSQTGDLISCQVDTL